MRAAPASKETAGTQWPRVSRASGIRPWGGIADNMLLCSDRESKARPQARTKEHRQPRRSFMPTSREADGVMAGSAERFRGAESRQREAELSDSSLAERNAGRGGKGVGVRPVRPTCSLTSKGQTNLVF